MYILTRIPHLVDEASISLDTHGLTGWVRCGVKVPAKVAEQALNGFFETQGTKDLTGWVWEDGAQAQELPFPLTRVCELRMSCDLGIRKVFPRALDSVHRKSMDTANGIL